MNNVEINDLRKFTFSELIILDLLHADKQWWCALDIMKAADIQCDDLFNSLRNLLQEGYIESRKGLINRIKDSKKVFSCHGSLYHITRQGIKEVLIEHMAEAIMTESE